MNVETPQRFPVMIPYSVRRWLLSVRIPWAMIAPHEERAQRNHGGQTLRRLAERGGLDPAEVLAVLEDRPWRAMDPLSALDELLSRVDAWREAHP